jgi:hypothetical protein
MWKIAAVVASALLLQGCGSQQSSVPEKVTVNGVEGFKVYAGAMLGRDEPNETNLKEMSAKIKTGDHGAGLRSAASRYCPTGYRILSESEPDARIYVFTPFVQYKVDQNFVIACKN